MLNRADESTSLLSKKDINEEEQSLQNIDLSDDSLEITDSTSNQSTAAKIKQKLLAAKTVTVHASEFVVTKMQENKKATTGIAFLLFVGTMLGILAGANELDKKDKARNHQDSDLDSASASVDLSAKIDNTGIAVISGVSASLLMLLALYLIIKKMCGNTSETRNTNSSARVTTYGTTYEASKQKEWIELDSFPNYTNDYIPPAP